MVVATTTSSKMVGVRKTGNGAINARVLLLLVVLWSVLARLGEIMIMVEVGITVSVLMVTLELKLLDKTNGAGVQSVNFLLMTERLLVRLVDRISVLGVGITPSRIIILLHRDRRIGIGAQNATGFAIPRARLMGLAQEVEPIRMLAVGITHF